MKRKSDHERYSDPNFYYGRSYGKKLPGNADPERCRWQVCSYTGNWPHYHQCSRKASVDGLWCKQHSPEGTQAREQRTQARWAEDRYRDSMKWWERACERKSLEAIKEIAKGEMNDPAGYAQMLLDEWDEERPKKP